MADNLKTPLLGRSSVQSTGKVVVDIKDEHVQATATKAMAESSAAAAGGRSQDDQEQARARAEAERLSKEARENVARKKEVREGERAKTRARAEAERLSKEARENVARKKEVRERERAKTDAQTKAEAERDAREVADKARQERVGLLAAAREKERRERMEVLSKGLINMFSEDFHKKISPDHEKRMEKLVEERAKLDEKAAALVDKCSVLTTPLYAYMTGTITLYGVVNLAMVATDRVGIWRIVSLVPFICLLNYFKATALDQLKSIEEKEMLMITNKRIELIRKMNQLRCSIDLAAAPKTKDKMKMPIEDEDVSDHLKLVQTIDKEAVGDNFDIDCEKILAIIHEPDFEGIKSKINATFFSALVVLLILGISFLVHVLYYFSPGSGSAPPPAP